MGVEGTGLLLLCCFPEGWPGWELRLNPERACLWGDKQTYSSLKKGEPYFIFLICTGDKCYFINDAVIAPDLSIACRALESEFRNSQSLVSTRQTGASCQLDPWSPSFISFFHILLFFVTLSIWQLLYEFSLTT